MVGLVLQNAEARTAGSMDPEVSRQALRKLHAMGTTYRDTNRRNSPLELCGRVVMLMGSEGSGRGASGGRSAKGGMVQEALKDPPHRDGPRDEKVKRRGVRTARNYVHGTQ